MKRTFERNFRVQLHDVYKVTLRHFVTVISEYTLTALFAYLPIFKYAESLLVTEM